MNSLNYMVVIFTAKGEEYVSAAPSQWLSEDTKLLWPPNKGIEHKAIKLNMKPEIDWITYEDVQVVGYYEANFPSAKDIIDAEIILIENTAASEDTKIEEYEKNIAVSSDAKNVPSSAAGGSGISGKDVSKKIANIEEHKKILPVYNDMENILSSAAGGSDIYRKEIHKKIVRPSSDDVERSFDNLAEEEILNKVSSVEAVSVLSSLAAGGSGISGNSSSDELLSELKQIKQFVIYTMRKIDSIEISLAKNKNIGTAQLEPQKSLLPKLPLMEIMQLRTLEDSLENESIRKELYDMLRYTGGSKERDCVNRCLEKVFSNYLVQYCSWTGKKNNYILSSMNLMTTIKLAVKETFANITDDSFERHVMAWFQHAGTRLKREN